MNSTENECCANTGATNHILHDDEAFILYHCCIQRYVTSEDETQLLVADVGTAKISLNGKILVCNILHVPDLWAPLY